MMQKKNLSIDEILVSWSTAHSFLLLPVSILCILTNLLWPLLLAGGISFSVFIFISRGKWSAKNGFGIANMITAFRLAGLFLFVYFGPDLMNIQLFMAALILLIFDGLDGWIAQKLSESSEFGSYFDKETDAYFMLLLAHLLFLKGSVIWPVILLGQMRYAFAIFLFIKKTEIKKERRSNLGRFIYVYVMLALISGFLTYPLFYNIFIFSSALLLIFSFGRDVLWILFQK